MNVKPAPFSRITICRRDKPSLTGTKYIMLCYRPTKAKAIIRGAYTIREIRELIAAWHRNGNVYSDVKVTYDTRDGLNPLNTEADWAIAILSESND